MIRNFFNLGVLEDTGKKYEVECQPLKYGIVLLYHMVSFFLFIILLGIAYNQNNWVNLYLLFLQYMSHIHGIKCNWRKPRFP